MLHRSEEENPQKSYKAKKFKFIIRSGGTMKASNISQGSLLKNPQTQFVTKDLLKEALKEYFQENPEVIKGAIKTALCDLTEGIKDQFYNIKFEQAKDKKRLSNIELLLGLDESLQDPENDFYEENKERYHQLFLNSVFSNIVQTQETGNVQTLLYGELKKVPSMRNKDVLNFMGWNKKNAMKATRLMQQMPEFYPDVVCDNAPGRKRALRIYIKH